MIEIYDDTDESTIPFDLKWSRALILLSIAACLIIATLGSFGNESYFHIPIPYGVGIFILSGIVSVGVYFLMYKFRKYPSLFASFTLLILGLSSYLTGFDINLGMGISTISIFYIAIYVVVVKVYNIDNPDT